jgi:nucleoside-diphosphate-sugar epimerase
MKSYQGKNVIITGGTGAIGSKVVKKLLKAGNIIIFHSDYTYRCESCVAGTRPTQSRAGIED